MKGVRILYSNIILIITGSFDDVSVEGKKLTQRLLAATAYKIGVMQIDLAEWDGVQRRTIDTYSHGATTSRVRGLCKTAIDQEDRGI